MERLLAYYWKGAEQGGLHIVERQSFHDLRAEGPIGFIQMQRAVVGVEAPRRSCKPRLPTRYSFTWEWVSCTAGMMMHSSRWSSVYMNIWEMAIT